MDYYACWTSQRPFKKHNSQKYGRKYEIKVVSPQKNENMNELGIQVNNTRTCSFYLIELKFILGVYSRIINKHYMIIAELMNLLIILIIPYCPSFLISLFMQKKVGIRLRHLEDTAQTRQQVPQPQPITRTQPKQQRQTSQSPLNRRKIFQQAQHQPPTKSVQPEPPSRTYQIRYNTQTSARPTTAPFTSPIMNQPLNNNNVSMNDQYQYESEVERLIESLKKKSMELQKKQQMINKLHMEIDLLRAENGEYRQQIKMLKAQIQLQRASQINSSRLNIAQNKKYSPVVRKLQQLEVAGNQKPVGSALSIYQNEPYQQLNSMGRKDQVIHIKLNPNKLKHTQANNYDAQYIEHNTSRSRRQLEEKEMKKKINRDRDVYTNHRDTNFRDKDKNREQDSVLSDYLSPLMVLNSEPMSQSVSPIYSKETKQFKNNQDDDSRFQLKRTVRDDDSRFELKKGGSRIDYEQKNVGQTDNSNTRKTVQNNVYSNSRLVENPFTKKIENKNMYQPAQQLQFNPPPPLVSTYSRQPQVQPKWSTLQSSAGHFNTNIEQSYPPPYPTFSQKIPTPNQHQRSEQYYRGYVGGHSNNNSSNRNRKQLDIEDSKQFKFQDFDFSQLDNSVANSQF